MGRQQSMSSRSNKACMDIVAHTNFSNGLTLYIAIASFFLLCDSLSGRIYIPIRAIGAGVRHTTASY